jgi:hypothetical protein
MFLIALMRNGWQTAGNERIEFRTLFEKQEVQRRDICAQYASQTQQ